MWAKGNLHTHTNLSDGDSSPDEVCRYYASRGYQFLSITDHNRLTEPRRVDSHGLTLIRGVEISLTAGDERVVPIHVNGFGVRSAVVPNTDVSLVEAMRSCVTAVVERGGIAQFNHPNFGFAYDHTHMQQVDGCYLMEVYNGHPYVYNDGDDAHIKVEEMWDHLLTAGRLVYGTAVDDAHHFRGDFAPDRANPSRGWICARVNSVTPRSILSALRRGRFYASTGVELEDVIVRPNVLRVKIKSTGGRSCITRFIGEKGRVLAESGGLDNIYSLSDKSGSHYVRATVTASDGSRAWTQPVFRDQSSQASSAS